MDEIESPVLFLRHQFIGLRTELGVSPDLKTIERIYRRGVDDARREAELKVAMFLRSRDEFGDNVK